MSDETEPPSDPDQSDQPPLSPELLPSRASDLAQGPEGLGRHSSLTMIFRQEVATAGGAVAWLTSRAPRALASLAAMVDPSQMESAILTETSSFWLMHEFRLRQCGRCPEGGAACVPQTTRLDEGLTVALRVVDNHPEEVATECSRYKDYQLTARLERSGVDKRFARLRMAQLNGELSYNVKRAFREFVDSLDRKRVPVGMELMIQGEQAREYGAVLLRLAMIDFPYSKFRSVHVPMLSRIAMNAMTMKEEYPFFDLIDPDLSVLLLDCVEQDSIKPNSWFRKELTLLYERRRDQGLATIITSTVPAKEAFPGVSVLRV